MSFTKIALGLAAVAPFVAAITVPGGSNPTAGAITAPYSTSNVTAGQEFTITWTAKTDGCGDKIDLVLLKGPSSSQMSAISYIQQGIANTGSYSWTPDSSLQASATDYGIEYICESTQAYQYSTRFGIANAGSSSGSGSSSASASGSSSASASGSASSSASAASIRPGSPIITSGSSSATGASASATETSTASGSAKTTSSASASGAAKTIIPSTSASKTSSASSSASAASSTGAAGQIKAGFGLVAAAGLAALAL